MIEKKEPKTLGDFVFGRVAGDSPERDVRALGVAVALLDDSLLHHALEALVAADVPDHVRTRLIGQLSRRASSHQLEHAIRHLATLENESRRAEVARILGATLPEALRRALIPIVRELGRPELRLECYAAIGSSLTDNEIHDAAVDLESVTDLNLQVRALQAIGMHLPNEKRTEMAKSVVQLAVHAAREAELKLITEAILSWDGSVDFVLDAVPGIADITVRWSVLKRLEWIERIPRHEVFQLQLATTDQMLDPAQRAKALQDLGYRADEDQVGLLLQRIADLPLEFQLTPYDSLTTRLMATNVLDFLARIAALPEEQQADLLASVGRHLPAGELPRALEICGLKPFDAVELIEANAGRLTPDLVARAIDLVPRGEPHYRVELLLALLPFVSMARRPALVDECIELTASHGYRWAFAGVIQALAPYLENNHGPSDALIAIAAGALSERNPSVEILKSTVAMWPSMALARLIEQASLEAAYGRIKVNDEALDATLTVVVPEKLADAASFLEGAPENRAELRLRLARKLGGPDRLHVVAAAIDDAEAALAESSDIDSRWLRTAAALVSESQWPRLLRIASRVKLEWWRALDSERFLSSLPVDALQQAFAFAEIIPNRGARLVAHALLAQRIGDDHERARRVRQIRAQLGPLGPAERRDVLLNLLPALSVAQRQRVAFELLGLIRDGASHEALAAMTQLVPWLTAAARSRAVEVVLMLSTSRRLDALRQLASHYGGLADEVLVAEQAHARVESARHELWDVVNVEATDLGYDLERMSDDQRQRLALRTIEAVWPAKLVVLGSSAPANVHRNDRFVARFVACAEHLETAVVDRLRQAQPDGRVVIGLQQRSAWSVGAAVSVHIGAPSDPELSFEPRARTFEWNGTEAIVDFVVVVPESAAPHRCVLEFEIALAGVSVARLFHEVQVTIDVDTSEPVVKTTRAPRTAFASYSSKDKNRVYDRVSALRSIADIDVFLDCLSIQPGEEFKPRIQQEIRSRELFLLFWSLNAKRSRWVKWEWQQAMEHQISIRPQPLESIERAAPPRRLRHLNFRDALNALRE